ncbi:hypothetical protein BGZ58_009261 [Dissophora ornata]|nr:hypothetical protein BGZ58_009261 [Dissophora ornata]
MDFWPMPNLHRHVSLPKLIARYVPNELMTEEEWRSLGIKQSQGWEHYMIHNPEPHVLLFKREKDYQAKYEIEYDLLLALALNFATKLKSTCC